MPRDYTVYLNDIRESIGLIKEYTRELSFEQFSRDRKTQDTVYDPDKLLEQYLKG